MSNFYLNSLNRSNTPVKRLGLSRKRKNFAFVRESTNHDCSTTATVETAELGPSENKMKKHRLGSTDFMKNSVSSKKEQNINIRSESQSVSKVNISQFKKNKTESFRDKVEALEHLYLIWKNGFKNAIFYLIQLLNKRQGETADIRKILSDLRISGKVKEHFKNDVDMDILSFDE